VHLLTPPSILENYFHQLLLNACMSSLMIDRPREIFILVNLLEIAKTLSTRLVLEQPQRTLDDHVLQNGTRGDVDR
jgi:hypothetical protein